MTRALALAALALAPFAAACGSDAGGGGSPGASSGPAVPPADHHVHVRSESATGAFRKAQRALDQQVIPEERLVPLDGDDAVAALDSAGVETGVLLSVAYMFGLPDVEFEDERRKVRAENDFVARQVERHPDRLVGFFSVNPLADYALEEIERGADDPRLTGLKLHLANSDVDLRDSEHVDRLAEVFGTAEELGVPVVIHLWTRTEDYGAEDVDAFVDRVLTAAPTIPVQVAHLGGGGGFSASTQRAVEAFARAFRDHPDRTENVVLDMAAVPVPEALAEGDSALVERVRKANRGFAEAVREIGLDRVVYGTDWDAASMPTYLEGVRSDLPLEAAEIRDLVDDRAPYLD
jgi:predicted TIM-barrel fold metal-dependent hydrolase